MLIGLGIQAYKSIKINLPQDLLTESLHEPVRTRQ
jgi:hypothetical protein